MRRHPAPADHPPLAGLPVTLVTVGGRDETMAVHVAGRLTEARRPVICVPGYIRNMVDFAAFVPLLQRRLGADWPVLLIDPRGRGRSADRPRAGDYTSLADARDLAEVARAFAIETAVFVGQGHGGQVLMALAATRPTLIGAAVLIDAGPAPEARSLVRLRGNAEAIARLRGATGVTLMLRRMLAADYPDATREELDRLAARTHAIDAGGRARPLFDPALIERLADIGFDDVLVPQWQFFDLLGGVPALFVRTELTDQLSGEVFAEMARRRPDAARLEIARQGSPALLDQPETVARIADFVQGAAGSRGRAARRA